MRRRTALGEAKPGGVLQRRHLGRREIGGQDDGAGRRPGQGGGGGAQRHLHLLLQVGEVGRPLGEPRLVQAAQQRHLRLQDLPPGVGGALAARDGRAGRLDQLRIVEQLQVRAQDFRRRTTRRRRPSGELGPHPGEGMVERPSLRDRIAAGRGRLDGGRTGVPSGAGRHRASPVQRRSDL